MNTSTITFDSFEKLKKGGIYIIEDVDLKYLNELKNNLKEFNPEIIILSNKYFDQNIFNKQNLNDNNLIVIRKNQ